MNLRISDMMNELTEESVVLEEETIVSAEAVERAVLQKLHGRAKPRRGRKVLMRSLLVAAVMTVLLSMAVLAGDDLRDIWQRPELQAAAEWMEYRNAKQVEYEKNGFPTDGTEAYATYHLFGCYSQEMVDDMRMMADSYNLTLPGMWHERYDTIGTIYRELETEAFLPAQSGRAAYMSYLDDGSFEVYVDAAKLANGETGRYWLYCIRKDNFHPLNMALSGMERDAYELIEYTAADGTKVLLYLGAGSCLVLTELDRCLVAVTLCQGTAEGVDAETLQAFADDLGFRVMDDLIGG